MEPITIIIDWVRYVFACLSLFMDERTDYFYRPYLLLRNAATVLSAGQVS